MHVFSLKGRFRELGSLTIRGGGEAPRFPCLTHTTAQPPEQRRQNKITFSLPAWQTPAPATGSRQAGLEASARRVSAFDQYHVEPETCREMARLPGVG